jgi:acetyltransferase-like isoleucine patch superfamily enzyme
MGAPFIHPRALCESAEVGAGTRIWAFAHVMAGARVGRDCNVGDHAFVENGAWIGDRVTVKNGALVFEGATIEDDVFLGPACMILNDRTPRSPRMAEAAERYADKGWLRETRVCLGASIGGGAILLPGIRVGRYALVAAGAVVTRDVRDHALAAGNPAEQRGWVCVCGAPLVGEPQAELACACGRAFRADPGGSLRPRPG